MKKEITVEELNKKINKIEKFKTKGIPVLNKITCTLIGTTIATMIARIKMTVEELSMASSHAPFESL